MQIFALEIFKPMNSVLTLLLLRDPVRFTPHLSKGKQGTMILRCFVATEGNYNQSTVCCRNPTPMGEEKISLTIPSACSNTIDQLTNDLLILQK
jgi:hypothetical protein